MATVKLIAYTPEPEKLVAAAAKLCYSKSDIDTLMDGLTEDKVTSFLNRLSNLGHQSPLEHVSFTFGIEDVSRAFLAQITRHRLASFSVASQRYVSMDSAGTIIPDEFEGSTSKVVVEQAYKASFCAYKSIKDTLTQEYIKAGMDAKRAEKKAQENARYVLPEGCATKMIVTMNARELLHFFELRCCNRAQDEIREVANQMLALVYPIAPHLFKDAGPSCVCGGCSEGAMTCGKPNEVRAYTKELKEGITND